MGWLSWVSLTSLLVNGSPDSSYTMLEKGITTRLFSSILFNDFYLFRTRSTDKLSSASFPRILLKVSM